MTKSPFPNTLTHLVKKQTLKYGSREAFSFREEGPTANTVTTWQEFDTHVDNGASALEILGIATGEHIGIFSANRPQNLILDFAAYAIRSAPVSIYSTSSQDQVEYIVDDAQIKVLGVGNRKQYEIARKAMKRCHSLEHLIALSNFHIDTDDTSTLTFEQFLSLGAEATDACRAEVEKRRNEVFND
ncbi:MAG: AMP-binding protein [Muribaculaceae bacterium]|nr:AMP-binding protein [Muribaculaceae bacterium]